MRYPSDTETRIAFVQAAEVAHELGHPTLGPEHLLLGLLADLRGHAVAALDPHGVTYQVARERVIAHHRGANPAAPSASSSYEEERLALAQLGLDLDRVREAVQQTFGEDIVDGWGERRPTARGGGRGNGRRGDEPRETEMPEGGGRGRRGPRSNRFGPRGLPLSPALRDILGAMRSAARSDLDAGSSDRGETRRRRGTRGPHGSRGPRQEGQSRGRNPGPDAVALLVALLRSDSAAVHAAVGDADLCAQVAAQLGDAPATT